MASVNQPVGSIFQRTFSANTQKQLMDDDHFAWQSVCSILITIVSMGLLLGTLGVVFSLIFG